MSWILSGDITMFYALALQHNATIVDRRFKGMQ